MKSLFASIALGAPHYSAAGSAVLGLQMIAVTVKTRVEVCSLAN